MVSQRPEGRVDLSSHREQQESLTNKNTQNKSYISVLTFQDAVDCRLESRVCVGVRGWGELRGVRGLERGVVRLSSGCERWGVTLGITVGGAAGPVVLLRSLQFQDALVFQQRRVESVCCTWSRSSTPSRVSIPGLGVCPVRRLRGASVWLVPATAGRRLRGERVLEKFGFHPTAEVFQEGVYKTGEEYL